MTEMNVEKPSSDLNIENVDPPTEWNEERINAAQQSLKEMYIQLRELRSTIPRLVAPLTTIQSSPEKLFQEIAAAASTANGEVRQFRMLMEDEESRKVFEHVRESRAQNPKDITPWRITQDPNWVKRGT